MIIVVIFKTKKYESQGITYLLTFNFRRKLIMENKETILKLSKQIMIDGKETNEIPYDFESLTGKDVVNAFGVARRNGYVITGPYEMDPVLGAYMFAEAAQIDYTDVERFSANDYTKAGSLGRNFFIKDLVGNQAKDTSNK
jgi:restriction endonuclease S subunit